MCVHSTTLCVCLLLLPHHFCQVSFCFVSLVLVLILHGMKGVSFWAYIISSWAWTLAWQKFLSIQSVGLLLLLLCPWACWLSFLPCRPIRFFYLFSWAFTTCYFTFTSCYAYGLAGYYSCHTSPLGFLPLLLSFHGPFTLPLLLVVPIGFLAVTLAILAHWNIYLLSWAPMVHLLYFYLLLCPWAY